MLTMHRPAILESDPGILGEEFYQARRMHHKLLDFELMHEEHLREVAEQIAPGIWRIGRILCRLSRFARRARKTPEGSWAPNPRPELAAKLRAQQLELRAKRNDDPRWHAALKWADEQVGEPIKPRKRLGKPVEKIKRRKNESQEAYDKRVALLSQDETDEHFAAKLAKAPRDTRRGQYRKALYASKERTIYWGTWNGLLKSVDQARADILKRRKQGLPADWRRPRWSDPGTLYADAGGFRIAERGPKWWVVELRVGLDDEWVRFRAKFGTWHKIPEHAKLTSLKLTRRRDGSRWTYSVSVTVDMDKPLEEFATRNVVSFDWGHREHGHETDEDGMRSFVWQGDDGRRGEVLVPVESREMLDKANQLKGKLDERYLARKEALGLEKKSRYSYRQQLTGLGVRTEEESAWLRWEMRYERQIMRCRKRAYNLRDEVYVQTVRKLRKQYGYFVFEDEKNWSLKQLQKDEQMERRKRSNRDLSARYDFVQLCERFGATTVLVSARNTTRECPDCGNLDENGPELLLACSGCGRVRDKDYGAARVILRRGQEALAKRAQSA